MKFWGKFFLAILSLSLLSYGISDAAYAAIEPLSVTTEEFYAEGNIITISGHVKDFDMSDDQKNMDVTIQIIAPNGNLVTVLQPTPNADGDYSASFKAGGMMKDEGDYTVKVRWGTGGGQNNQITFKYGGSSGAPVPEDEPTEQVVKELEVEAEREVDVEPVMGSSQPVCGPGTVLKNNVCVAEQQKKGGGCLIATAAFGSELAPQIQFLREIRDNTVLQTQSGSVFMTGFNQFYYSFSPTIADYERENPAFKEAIKLTLTPLLTSLTLLQYADIDSESEMLGYGIGVILLNIGMYFVAPAVVIFKIKNRK